MAATHKHPATVTPAAHHPMGRPLTITNPRIRGIKFW